MQNSKIIDRLGNELAVGDYVWRQKSSKLFGQIKELSDIWCIDQWVANVCCYRTNNKTNKPSEYNIRIDVKHLEKISDEQAMILKLET